MPTETLQLEQRAAGSAAPGLGRHDISVGAHVDAFHIGLLGGEFVGLLADGVGFGLVLDRGQLALEVRCALEAPVGFVVSADFVRLLRPLVSYFLRQYRDNVEGDDRPPYRYHHVRQHTPGSSDAVKGVLKIDSG